MKAKWRSVAYNILSQIMLWLHFSLCGSATTCFFKVKNKKVNKIKRDNIRSFT